MKRLIVAFAVLVFAGFAVADEVAAAAEPKKRPPRKEKEYKDWDKAAAVAEAWEQPILAFIETSGHSEANKLRLATIEKQGVDFFKEFVKPNCVLFHVKLPAVKEKRNNNGNNNQRREKKPPVTDLSSLKPDERALISRLVSGKAGGNQTMLAIVLCDSSGGVIDGTLGSGVPETFYGWIGDVKSAMEGRKYAVEISKKLQSVMDKEKKAKEKLDKAKEKAK